MNTFIDQDGKPARLPGKNFVTPPPSGMTPTTTSAENIKAGIAIAEKSIAEGKTLGQCLHEDSPERWPELSSQGVTGLAPEDPRKHPGIEWVKYQQRIATEALAPLAQSKIKAIDNLQKVTGLRREVCEAALSIANNCSQGAFQLLIQSKQIFQIA